MALLYTQERNGYLPFHLQCLKLPETKSELIQLSTLHLDMALHLTAGYYDHNLNLNQVQINLTFFSKRNV